MSAISGKSGLNRSGDGTAKVILAAIICPEAS